MKKEYYVTIIMLICFMICALLINGCETLFLNRLKYCEEKGYESMEWEDQLSPSDLDFYCKKPYCCSTEPERVFVYDYEYEYWKEQKKCENDCQKKQPKEIKCEK